MTTLEPISVACPGCGHSFERMTVGSSYRHGAPDLDLRPPPLARDLHVYDVVVCGRCGFPALVPDEPEAVRPLVAAMTSGVAVDATLPSSIAALEHRARLEHSAGSAGEAGHFFVRAAWIADDREDEELARRLRRDAAVAWRAAIAAGDLPAEPDAAADLLVADVLRRAGDLASASEQVTAGLARATDAFIVALLRFEQDLIEAGDVAAHQVDEAPGRPGDD